MTDDSNQDPNDLTNEEIVDRLQRMEAQGTEVFDQIRNVLLKYDELPEDQQPSDLAIYYAASLLRSILRQSFVDNGMSEKAMQLMDRTTDSVASIMRGKIAEETDGLSDKLDIPEGFPSGKGSSGLLN